MTETDFGRCMLLLLCKGHIQGPFEFFITVLVMPVDVVVLYQVGALLIFRLKQVRPKVPECMAAPQLMFMRYFQGPNHILVPPHS